MAATDPPCVPGSSGSKNTPEMAVGTRTPDQLGLLSRVAFNINKRVRGFFGRELAKAAIGVLIDWPRAAELKPGYSVILGVPWHLRHLLEVNLRFLAKLDRRHLRAIHVVLDRASESERDRLERTARACHPQLPLVFQCYEGMAGRIVERLDISTFYNSMNCATALAAIDSTHAILHDFDLYPLRPDYFERMYQQMVRGRLHYCGVEVTCFDGLTSDDQVLGTWGLGMDVEWLRRTHRPIEIFHTMRTVGDRVISLDPFSESQLRPGVRRELVTSCSTDDFCHVKNLCSSYLRFSTGRWVSIAWRLHYLWYLESLIGQRRLEDVIARMEAADGSLLEIDGRSVDFKATHPTCANVLRMELARMDEFLFGEVRPEVVRYVDAFWTFLDGMAAKAEENNLLGDQRAA